MTKNVHVVPNGDNWAVEVEGNKRKNRITSTQSEAIGIGRGLAQNNKSELLIHGKNGQIREKNSYGNDKFPPRG
jgi:hypothetical protein